MMKRLKKIWFPALCFLGAIAIAVTVLINIFLIEDEEIAIMTLLSVNCLTPSLLLIAIGAANLPTKEDMR